MKPIESGNSKHHLFSYYEIKKNLIKVFGEPKNSEEHLFLHKEIKRIQKIIPQYALSDKLHKEIHKNDCPFLNKQCPIV